jgi:hypothetical protein
VVAPLLWRSVVDTVAAMAEASGATEVPKTDSVKPSRGLLKRVFRLWLLCIGCCLAVIVVCMTVGALFYRGPAVVWFAGSPWSRGLDLPWYELVSFRAADILLSLFVYPIAYVVLCVPMIFLGGWVIGDLPDGASLAKKIGVWVFLFVPPLVVEVVYLLWYHHML